MAIEIKETCSCGAEFYVKDGWPLGNTAVYRYRDFLKAHKICRDADSMRNKTTTTYKTDDE
jgi:hypothetical protein